jgi:hypothetical protein
MGLFMFIRRIISNQRLAASLATVAALAAAGSAQATTLTLKLTADNAFDAYLSTSDATLGALIGSGSDWTNTYSFSQALPGGGPLFLHIVAVNGGGPDGFIGSFGLSDAGRHFSTGGEALDTDTADWKADPFGGTWAAPAGTPISEGLNGVGPWGPRAGINGSAAWIWTSPDSAMVEFSTPLLGVAAGVPEPAAWGVMLLGLFGTGALLRARRRQERAAEA